MQFRKKDKPIIISDNRRRKHSFRERIRSIWNLIQFPDLSENKYAQFLEKYSLIVHGILSCILIFVIEWISRRSLHSALSFVYHSPLVFLYNALLIFVTLLIPYLFRHRGLFRIIISIFWLLLGIVNGCVLASRVTPFNFTDLKLVGDLLSMKDSQYFSVGQGVAVVVALALVVIFLILFAIKGPFYKEKIHRIRNLIFLGIAIAAVPFITKAAIHNGILAGYFGNLAEGYSDYGFVYSFTASTVDTGMREPSNYSKDTIDNILDSVKTKETSVSKEDMPNIIFVQLESLVDPEEIKFLKMSKDPIPTLRSLQKNYTTGYLTVPIVGAGTVNTEFEVLTGLGIQYFGLGEYPYKTVLKETSCESAASDLSDLGYSTHALHNNGGNFYSRAKVFANMGFDTYTCKEMMNILEYNEIHSWPADHILLEETQKAMDYSENQPDFLYTITVQSHGNYPGYKVFDDPEVKVTGGETEEKNYQWEYYVNEVYQVDQFVSDLIDQLSKRDEKTILVLYGDHLPTMGLTDDDMKSGDLYKTRYYTWNNFGLEKKDKDLTSYQLMAYITDQLGIHEGTIFRYHQNALAKKSLNERKYLKNLQLLQYDLLYGKRYAYNEEDLYPATDMEMGVEDTRLTDYYVNFNQTKLIIRGENFTPWSKVFVNGKKVSTSYISDKAVQIYLDDVADGDTLVVNQMGSSDTVFRSSNEVTYVLPDILKNKDSEESTETDTNNQTDNGSQKNSKTKNSKTKKSITDAIHSTIKQVDEDLLND